MKQYLFVAALVVVILTAGAVAAFAAPGGPGRFPDMMGQAFGGPRAMMDDDLEALLGIDHAAIHAAHVAGKSLVEIAAEQGVTEDALIQTLLDGRKAALRQAVADGRLSQAAANQMLKFMETNIQTMVEAQGMSSMMNGAGAWGMMGGAGHMRGEQGGPNGGCHGVPSPAQGIEL